MGRGLAGLHGQATLALKTINDNYFFPPKHFQHLKDAFPRAAHQTALSWEPHLSKASLGKPHKERVTPNRFMQNFVPKRPPNSCFEKHEKEGFL